jgi:hypothetical protein
MASSVTAHWDFRLDVDETLDLQLDLPDDPTYTHKIPDISSTNVRGTLDGSSTVPATKVFSDMAVMSSGELVLDLTSLTSAAGSSESFDGLKVQLVKIAALTSSGEVVVQKGDTNAYNLLGYDNASSETLEVLPGGCAAWYLHDSAEDVSSTKCNVKFTSSNNNCVFYIVMVAG